MFTFHVFFELKILYCLILADYEQLQPLIRSVLGVQCLSNDHMAIVYARDIMLSVEKQISLLQCYPKQYKARNCTYLPLWPFFFFFMHKYACI